MEALTDRLAGAIGTLPDPERVRIVRAPGRVNLIGEHTDYNDGFVLPAAIDLEIRIAYVPTDDGHVRLASAQTGDTIAFDARDPGPRHESWRDYVAGTAWSMLQAGLPTAGFTGVLESSVPVGAGLSSSAALELASAWALSGASPPPTDPLTLARIAQRAENDYVGMRCGLMDQFASAAGVADAAVLLDCRTLEHRPVALPDGLRICVIHTGVPRTLVGSAYNDRRSDCERAVRVIQRTEPGVTALRDVDAAMLERARDALDEVAFMRARHVIDENARVLAAIEAFAAGDLDAIGELFGASHTSLRDLYQVSCPELDVLVDIAAATPGVVAARMTGAGFGGCTVNLVRPDAIEELQQAVMTDYRSRTGREPRMWVVRAVDGAGPLEV
jgi:galactokinase